MKKTLLLFSLCALALPAAALPGPSSAVFAKGVQFTVAGYTGNETLSGFPILVRLSENSPVGFSYNDVMNRAAADKRDVDVAFVGMDGTPLPFEIDTWDAAGESLVWVRLPSMSSGTSFVMCWGSESSGTNVCSANPWSDYAGVWHMNDEDDGAATISDATENHLDAKATSVSYAQPSGRFGGARTPTKNGNNKDSNCIKVDLGASNSTERAVVDGINTDANGHSFTVSMWVKPEKYNGAGTPQSQYLVGRKLQDETSAWGVQYHYSNGSSTDYGRIRTWGSETMKGDSDMLSFDFDDSVIPANAENARGKWYKYDVVYSGSTVTFYVNGGTNALAFLTGTLKISPAGNESGDLYLAGTADNGTREFCGDMDEVRLRGGAMSAAWVAADWATQTDPAFLSAGPATPYEETSDPVAGVSVSDVSYTNATVTATVALLGAGATSADVTVTLSASSGFETALWSTNYTVLAADDVRSFSPTGLVFGTTYHVRATVVNNAGANPLVTGVSTFTTLSPGAPSGTAAFLSRGFTTLAATASASDIGTGAQSATIRLEASTDGFTNVVASTEIAAVPGQTETLVAENLTPGQTYGLRVRIMNDWGVATYLDLPETTTYAVPFAVTGIGWTFSPDDSTVDFTFGVSGVFDGATGTARLEYDGRTVSSQTFSSAGTLVWPNVPAAAGTATATVTVSADVDGTTYTNAWTATVAPGTAAYVVSSLADLANVALRVGDSVTLPEPAVAGDHYLPLDVRVFSVDGTTLTAVGPGFSAVCAMEWDGDAGAYVRNATMGLAVCIPEAEGRVFLANAGGANMNWSETAKWRCLTDSSVTNVYPNGAGDVAMVPLAKDRAITLDVDAMVGAVYVGWDASAPASGKAYFRATNHALTFDSGAVGDDKNKIPGLFRITGLTRADVNADRPEFTFGGSAAGNRLAVVIPDGLDIDGGKCTDYANTTLRNNHNRLRFFNGYGDMAVPAGKTLHLDHFDHSSFSDGQMHQSTGFKWQSGFPITGDGMIVYDSAALGYFGSALKNFTGTLVIRQKERYAGHGIGSREGGFWLYAGVGYEASNATFVIEGEVAYAHDTYFPNCIRPSLGVATYGSTHGSGSWGPGDNSFGGKAMVMAGGVLLHRGNNDNNWKNNGIFTLPNRSDALVVSNGYSAIDQSSFVVALPTNRTEFASLRHENRGTVLISTTDTSNYKQEAKTESSHCIIHNAEGFAIGSGGADGSYRESIFPWIVSFQQWTHRLYFPYLGTRDGETNCIVLYKHPTSKTSLAAASDPDENVFVNEKTIALSEDVTVNALYLNNNWSKGTALGEGMKLTVTSGGVVLENARSAIGKEADFKSGTAGTLYLPNEGYLYSTRQSATEPNEVWASIVAPKGLAISFPGYFRMGGDQTGIDEELAINGCDVTLGSATTGCTIDVPVRLESGAAKLRIGKQGSFCRQDLYLNDHAGAGPKFEAAAGTEETVHKLFVDGVSMPRGYYGSSDAADDIAAVATRSHPAFVDDTHFAGTGWIKVMTDEVIQPTILILR